MAVRGSGGRAAKRAWPPPVRRVEAIVDTGRAVIEPDRDRPSAATLWVDGTPQSHVDLADPTYLVFEYVQHIAAALDVALPSGKAAVLHLGGGALTLPRYLAATRPGSVQRVVEIDAALIELVRAELPLAPAHQIRISTGDARDALDQQRAGSVDAVVADVFAAARVPARLTTVEFFAACGAALRPGGVLVYNFVDGHRLRFARRLIASVAAQFRDVTVAAEPGVWRGRRFSNLVLIASQAELPVRELTRRLAGGPFQARLEHGAALAAFVGSAAALTDATAEDSPAPPPRAFDLRH